MRTVPIPGEILRTDVFLGLTFDELVILGSVPLVTIFPSLFIKQIPLFATLGITLLSALCVVAVVIRTPDGQTPLEWAPAAMKRRFTPDTYYLKPRTRNRDTIIYSDVVHTADQIGTDTNEPQSTVASKVDVPDAVPTDPDSAEPILDSNETGSNQDSNGSTDVGSTSPSTTDNAESTPATSISN